MAGRSTVEAFTRATDPRYQPAATGRMVKPRTVGSPFPENRNRART